MPDSIAILDFGSQYTQLIARRVRELSVYSELFPCDAAPERVMSIHPKGFILSGGPNSVYTAGAPQLPAYVLESGLPVLGICYGMQAITHAMGGKVASSTEREYGQAVLNVIRENELIPASIQQVWMSHGDRIDSMPPGFIALATSDNCPFAAMSDPQRKIYGIQFHPEVRHTPQGFEILRRFVLNICDASPDWTAESIIQDSISKIRAAAGSQRVLSAVSGGVDSSVATALVHRAIGDQLTSVFVDTGLLRQDERSQVEKAFDENLGASLITVDAETEFLSKLKGVTDPEEKRRIIGTTFIRTFEKQAEQAGHPPFLVQGTIYPDVVESSAPERNKSQRIKTHHNVGGLPENMQFKLIEPLRYLFKDEVRLIGEALGLPHDLVWRQPFPGPGLAVRCLGEITAQRLARLRAADAIFTGELAEAHKLRSSAQPAGAIPDVEQASQAFAVLLPVRSVGVMGDQRTYQETIVLRAVATDDFMTADWARLPQDLLAKVANRIVNEVDGINRVVYDITSKPPATIEWE
jgi:GMP synthase (glutamine-hydrolysing)